MKQRIDFHIHTFHSDGVMLPSEAVTKAIQLNHKAIALTDHADDSNIEELIYNFKSFLKMTPPDQIEVIIGVELSYIYPEEIEKLAIKARELGAQVVLVHGESPLEQFGQEINQASLEAQDGLIDIIAHPGFITQEQAQLAAQKNIYLELTSRKGHCLANGHIAKMAQLENAKMLINTDAHAGGDLINFEFSTIVARGAGLNEEGVRLVTEVYPEELLAKIISSKH